MNKKFNKNNFFNNKETVSKTELNYKTQNFPRMFRITLSQFKLKILLTILIFVVMIMFTFSYLFLFNSQLGLKFKNNIPNFLSSRLSNYLDKLDYIQVELNDDVNTRSLIDAIQPDYLKEKDFYSSTLDLLIKYTNFLELFFIEEKNYVTFKIYGNYFDFGYIKFLDEINHPKEVKDHYKNFFHNLDKLEISEIQNLSENDIFKINISYQKEILDKVFVENRIVLFKKILDKKYLILEFVYLDNNQVNKYLEFFTYILQKSVYKPTISDNINLSFGTQTASKLVFSLNQKKWLKTYQSPKLNKFQFNTEYENDLYKNFISTLEVRDVSLVSKYIDPNSSIFTEAKRKLDDIKSKYQDVNVILDVNSRNIDKFEVAEFNVSYFDNVINSKIFLYFIYINYDESNYLIINLLYPDKTSNAFLEFNNVLNSIIKQEKTSYKATKKSNVLGQSVYTIDKASILGKPSTVKIYNRTCLDLQFSKNNSIPNLSGKKYTYCGGGYGSGFFVSSDGYLVTNAHVATPNPEEVLLNFFDIDINKKFLDDLYKDLKNIAGNNFTKLTDTDLLKVAHYIILKSIDDGILNIQSKYENYILKHNQEFKISTKDLILNNPSDVYKAEIVSYKNIPSFRRIIFSQQLKNLSIKQDKNLGQQDLAILKISNDQGIFPVIKLADPNTIIPGSNVVVIGYPGIVELSGLFKSSSISTLTKGTVSAIKKDLTGNYNLVQIDASISSGNSGGPILTADGELIGVSTYGITAGGADFNAGVFVDSVYAFLKENNVKTKLGEINNKLAAGLQDFYFNRYKLAIQNFNYVIQNWEPFVEVLVPLINISNKLIQEGKDKSNVNIFDNYINGNWIVFILVSITLLVIILFVLILVFYLSKNRSSKKFNRKINIDYPISNNNITHIQKYENNNIEDNGKPPLPPLP